MKSSQNIYERSKQPDFFRICKNCKIGCCRGARPPITPSRRRTIENYLRREGIKIETPFEKTMYLFPKENEDGNCIFFNKDTGKCIIHLVKPETCVSGPVTFDINLKTGKIEWFLKMERICPLAGALYKDKEAFLRHLEPAKREIITLVHELNPEELSAILKIEEPETFKIGEDELDPKILAKLTAPLTTCYSKSGSFPLNYSCSKVRQVVGAVASPLKIFVICTPSPLIVRR